MRQRVRLRIEIDPTWRANDRLQVFTDWGTGTIDTDKPLLFRPVRIFPDDPREDVAPRPWMTERLGTAISSRARGGRSGIGEEGLWPAGGLGAWKRYRAVEVLLPSAYGTWKFACRVIDGAGNEQGDLVEFSRFMSGEDPAPVASFAYDSFDDETDKATFAIGD